MKKTLSIISAVLILSLMSYAIYLSSPTAFASSSIYYVDGHTGITNVGSAWTNPNNGFDGNSGTSATSGTSGSISADYLDGKGTTAPSSGGTITSVTAYGTGDAPDGGTTVVQVYTSGLGQNLGEVDLPGNGISSPVTLTAPSGGWTWSAIQNLEVKVYGNGGDLYTLNIINLNVTYAQILGPSIFIIKAPFIVRGSFTVR